MPTFCTYFDQGLCRSCGEIPVPMLEQIARKEYRLKETLSQQRDFQLLPTVTGALTGFRNKAKMSVSGTLAEPILGLLKVSDLDQGQELLDCPAHHPKINEVVHGLKRFITNAKIEPYRVSVRSGELKGLILFYSSHSQEMLIRFVTRSQESYARIKKHAPSLLSEFPFIKMISGNVQPVPHAILEGPEEFLLAGEATITHQLGVIPLKLSPRAFVQTNQEVAEKLYQTAADWMKEVKVERLAELFCGQGAFSFFAKDTLRAGLGIEVNADAVKTANNTAKSLNAPHLEFKQADAAQVRTELEHFRPDAVLVNPPRRGLGEVTAFFEDDAYPLLIYSSCSLQSFAKDLERLKHYQLERVQIFDLFPHTEHFEILGLLRRREATLNRS